MILSTHLTPQNDFIIQHLPETNKKILMINFKKLNNFFFNFKDTPTTFYSLIFKNQIILYFWGIPYNDSKE